MLSTMISIFPAMHKRIRAKTQVVLASVFLLMTATLSRGVEVFLVPVAQYGYETNLVPATMKLMRTSTTGNLTVCLSLDPDSVAQIGVDYTVSGTGITDPSFSTINPLDSTDLTTSTIVIPNGQSEVLISITPIEDALVEARESMVFNIKPINNNYEIGAPSSMSLIIADNDHKARIQVPDPVADEDSALFGLVSDPDVQRRAVMRVRFDKFASGDEFTRNLAVNFVTVGGTQPIATLSTDYNVKYKICGNGNGITEERSRIGYDKVNIRGTGLNYTLIAHLAGETQISISGASSTDDVLPANSTLRFSNHGTVYSVLTAGPNGIVLNSQLQANLPNGTAITVLSVGGTGTAEPPTNLVVQRVYPAGSTSINVDFGSGGLFEGDVFQIDGHSGFYVVTSDTASLIGTLTGTVSITNGSAGVSGTGTLFTTQLAVGDYIYVSGQRRRVTAIASATALTVDANFTTTVAGASFQTDSTNMSSGSLSFRRYQGAGTGGGLEIDTGGSPNLVTLISATVTGSRMQVLVPEESAKVEISVTPVANGDGAEGVEEVRMRMIADEDYELQTPQEAAVYIADRDVSTSISVVSNAGLPNQTGFFKVTFSAPFPRSITVPYLVTDSISGPGSSDEYNEALPGSVTLIAGQTEALIQVDPISEDANNNAYATPQSLTLTLIAGLNYKLSGSTSSGVNPSATMNIADSVGAVTIAASTATATESATTPVNGQFTLTINRNSGQAGAIGVTLNVAGTAVNGSRYEFFASGGSVIAPVNNQIQVTIPAGTAPGTTTTTVGVRPINNFLADGDQIVQLTIVDGPSYLVGTPSTASVTVDDDEPTVSVTAVSDATRPATPGFFLFSYDGSPLSQAVQVNFTYGGTGVINTDFTASATVTIPSSSNATTLAINPIDTAEGSSETVSVTINPSSAYTIGTSSASISIDAATSTSGNKPTPGSVTSSKGGGCGLGSGIAGILALGFLSLIAFRRRQS